MKTYPDLTNNIFLALLQEYFDLDRKLLEEGNCFHLHLCSTSTYRIIWWAGDILKIFKSMKETIFQRIQFNRIQDRKEVSFNARAKGRENCGTKYTF